MQRSEYAVEEDPCEYDQDRCVVVRDDNVGVSGLLEVSRELLLAAGTSDAGREKSGYHLAHKENPQRRHYEAVFFKMIHDCAFAVYQAADPQNQQNYA